MARARCNRGRRARHLRGVAMRLECGHEHVESTGCYRVSRDLQSVVYGGCLNHGVWCFRCRAVCQPVELLGTVRFE